MMSEWKQYRLSDIVDIIGGGTPKTSVPAYWGGDIPWLSVVDFNNDNRYVYTAEKSITQMGLANSSTRVLKKGCLIISARGTVGALAQLNSDMAFNQSCYGLNAKENTTNDFLYYLVKDCIRQLQQQATGGVFDTIVRETFENIVINLPPIPEQHDIASMLSSLDDKIDLLHRQNKTSEELAQVYFSQWFVEGVTRNGSLSDIASIVNNSISTKNRATEFFFQHSIPAYDEGMIPIQECGGVILSNKFEVLPNVILVSKLNPQFSRIWRIGSDVKPNSVCSTEFQVVKAKEDRHYNYIYFLLKQKEVTEHFAMSASGTSGSHQRITPSDILNLEIVLPENVLIKKFNEICDPLLKRVDINKAQMQVLRRLRDTLLSKLINGEVRVKVEEKK